jgi:soluble lytic murein transglycosylase
MHRLVSAAILLACLLFGAEPAYARTASPKVDYRSALLALDKGQTEQAITMLRRGPDPVLNKVLRARLMAQPGNDYSFADLSSFVSENPDWPDLNGILMIAEQKIPTSASPEQVSNWFATHPALTNVGFYRHMDALTALDKTSQAAELIKARWINRDLGADEQVTFRNRYSQFLTAADMRARLDRLLWENNITGARAMYPLVSGNLKTLSEARLALANELSNADALVDQVPAINRNDPGLLYERLRWRRKNNLDEGAVEILLNAPDNLGDADKWWAERAIITRRVMEQKNFPLAYRLVGSHGVERGINRVHAEFLAGWLALRKLKRPDLAQQHFQNLLNEATTPVSRARGAYWLGLAIESLGDKPSATQAYEQAAVLNTTFYGQLAAARLNGKTDLKATAEPEIPDDVRRKFLGRDMVQAVQRLSRAGLENTAIKFFKANMAAAERRVEFALLIELAKKMGRPDWAIMAAKAASQKNMIMRSGAYPLLSNKLPDSPHPAFIHALIRQESQFDPDALSPAGARGLMQVLPSTAKDVARKEGIAFNAAKLSNPDYNIRIGSAFMRSLLDRYNGSYILALAAYNAGPGRVREWLATFGDPRTGAIDPIDWLELIPIYETRNYVQRIMENFQIYRARLNGGQHPLMLVADLRK